MAAAAEARETRETREAREARDNRAQDKAILRAITGVEWVTTAEAARMKGSSADHMRDYARAYLERAEREGIHFPPALLDVGSREVQAVRLGPSVRKSTIYLSLPSVQRLQMNVLEPDGRKSLHSTGKPVGWHPARPYQHRKDPSKDLRYRSTRQALGLPTQDQMSARASRAG